MPPKEPVKMQLRLPPELHEKLKDDSQEAGRSLNSHIIYLLEQASFGSIVPRSLEPALKEQIRPMVSELVDERLIARGVGK